MTDELNKTLRLADHIDSLVTREQVARLPLEGVTEVDFEGLTSYGVSALDELMHRTSGAAYLHMDDWTRQQYEWVLEVRSRK